MARRKRTQEQIDVNAAENGAVLEDENVVETTEDQVQVTEAEVTAEAEAQAEETGDRCGLCNRPLRAEQSVTRGLGPVCAGHVARLAKAQGLDLTVTDENAESYVAPDALTALIDQARENAGVAKLDPADFNADEQVHPSYPDSEPQRFVKLSEVDKAVKAAGRSMSKFVQAFGGDRGQLEPLNEHWAPVYVGRTRYLPATALERIEIDLPLLRERKAKEAVAETAPDAAETPAEAEDTGEIADEEVAAE